MSYKIQANKGSEIKTTRFYVDEVEVAILTESDTICRFIMRKNEQAEWISKEDRTKQIDAIFELLDNEIRYEYGIDQTPVEE